MFEQSILAGHPTHKGFGFAVSLSAQAILAGIAILIPLIYTQRLPFVPLSTPLTVPPAPPAPALRTAAGRSAPRTAAPAAVFVAPRRIPAAIAQIVDLPAAIELPANSPGVPGGIGTGGGLGALSNLAEPPTAPPKTETAARQAPTKPIRVSTGAQEAKLIRKVLPIYPALARQARISGTVHLVGIIAKDGTIQNLQVLSGHPLLVRAVVEAVRQWVYRPTLLNGEPVEVTCPIDVNFTLN